MCGVSVCVMCVCVCT